MSDDSYASSSASSDTLEIQPWLPSQHCRLLDSFEVRMSRGFLRSAPARWFPGLNSHWLPLFHANGVEMKVLDVAPLLTPDRDGSDRAHSKSVLSPEDRQGLEAIGAWLIDQEPIVFYADTKSRKLLTHAFIPNTGRHARKIMLEYICRRLAFSLQASWSGLESSQISYESEFAFENFNAQAWIRVRVILNNERVTFLFGLSRILAEKLDGLWRRQIQPGNSGFSAAGLGLSRQQDRSSNIVRIELARLSVAPQSLPSYLKVGSLIDLEIPLSTNLILKKGDSPWLSASLCCSADKFALETISSSSAALQVVEGATPLCIEFGTLTLDRSTCAELEQTGAMIETDLAISDHVHLSIRGEHVGDARLVCFEGRFAISIL